MSFPSQGGSGGSGDGSLTSGGTASGAIIIDAGGGSSGGLTINDSGSNGDVLLYEDSNLAHLSGVGGIYLETNTITKFVVGASVVQSVVDLAPTVAGTPNLGTSALGWGSLHLGDATAQVELSHDGATDGVVTVKDPNAAADGALRILDTAGTDYLTLTRSSSQGLVATSSTDPLGLGVSGAADVFVSASAFYPADDGSTTLGTSSASWGTAYLSTVFLNTAETANVSASALRLVERSSDATQPAEGVFVVWMSDGTGKGDDGDVLIASTAGGATKYSTLLDHSAGAAW